MKKIYIYRGKTIQGKECTGKFQGNSTKEVIVFLEGQNLIPLEIHEEKREGNLLRKVIKFPRKKVGLKLFSQFINRFQLLMGAGIPIIQCLILLREQTKDRGLSDDIQKVFNGIQNGGKLSQELARHPKTFPKFFVFMVKAGEKSGRLNKILEDMGRYYEKELENQEKIRKSLFYPAILVMITVMVLLFLLVKVLPTFVALFETSQIELPQVTLVLLGLSHGIKEYGLFLIPLVALGAIGGSLLLNLPEVRKGKEVFDFRIPILGNLKKKKEMMMISKTLSLLLDSGIDLLGALKLVVEITQNYFVKEKVAELSQKISRGGSLSKGMTEVGFFSTLIIEMVSIGEKSGNLVEVLEKCGKIYEVEYKNQLDVLTSSLEPGLILLMGMMVFFILSAIMLPVFELYMVYSSM
ncbi:MAG: type II secretion system F family protein [Eubacteriaceae bacterium]